MDINKYIGNKIRDFRERNNITQQELAEYLDTTAQSISRYEIGERKTNQDILFKLAEFFKISINEFFPPLSFQKQNNKIPILENIKPNIPIDKQEIKEYLDSNINNKYYAFIIKDDTMYPKYLINDIVIFKITNDFKLCNNKDCILEINNKITFMNLSINKDGISLIPLNLNNTKNIKPIFYTNYDIKHLPIKLIGIAKEIRTRLD